MAPFPACRDYAIGHRRRRPGLGRLGTRRACPRAVRRVRRAPFAAYAAAWRRIIPRCGGHLVGYFLPHEGTNDEAWGLIAFPSLAAYEAYRTRLRADREARANFDFAAARRFIRRERRTFTEVVDGTLGVPPLPPAS